METMNRIPVEILEYIFYQLGIDDLLTCKLVCPKFYFVIRNMKIKNLVLTDKYTPINQKYFILNEKVNCKHLIQTFNFKLDNKLSLPLFDNLKSLYIYSKTLQISNHELINQFKQLISLEIIYSTLIIHKGFCLILKNLKFLNLDRTQFNFRIYLDLPQLKYFKLVKSNSINLAHPQTVTTFYTLNYSEFIKSFINLEYLYCKIINLKDDNFLLAFPKLKLIYLDESKQSYDLLRKQRLKFDKIDLLIYYCGLNLNESLSVDFKYLGFKSLITYYKNNYQLIANKLPFNTSLNYNILDKIFKKIPIDFIRKFDDLDELKIFGPVNNKQQLINLIKECDGLNSLIFYESQLDQQFFNQLVLINKRIECLIIKREQLLDFEFLIKLEELESFETDQELSFELIRKIIIKFKRLYRLITKEIQIHFENNEYFLIKNSKLVKRNLNLKDLFKEI